MTDWGTRVYCRDAVGELAEIFACGSDAVKYTNQKRRPTEAWRLNSQVGIFSCPRTATVTATGGGIGGLLARNDRAQAIPGLSAFGGLSQFGTPSYYRADGNGNVTMLIASSQMIVAKYLYDSFGNTLAKCGLLADVNNYRFSSKEWNANSGLYYYLYRFYDSNLQRWLNRDPIQEWGGFNQYRFVRNTPISGIDAFGLKWWQGLPIINLYNCFSKGPGEKPSDYSVPSPSCKECESDPESAEKKCNDAVNRQENAYLGDAMPSLITEGIGDGLLAGGGLIAPPVWLGLIPNGIATFCDIKGLFNMSNAADQYKKQNCKCK